MKNKKIISCLFAGLMLFNSSWGNYVATAATVNKSQVSAKSREDFEAKIASQIKGYVNSEPAYVKYCKDALTNDKGDVNIQMQTLDVLSDFDLFKAFNIDRRMNLQYTEVGNILLEIAKDEENKGIIDACDTAKDRYEDIESYLDKSDSCFSFGELLKEVKQEDLPELYKILKNNDNTYNEEILNKYFADTKIKKKFEKYFEKAENKGIIELRKIAQSSNDLNDFVEKAKKSYFTINLSKILNVIEPVSDGLKVCTVTADSISTAEVLSKVSEDTQNRFKILSEDTKDEKVKKIVNEFREKTQKSYSENLTNAFMEGYFNEFVIDNIKDNIGKVSEKFAKCGTGVIASAILGAEIGSNVADVGLNSKGISEKDIKVISCLVMRNSVLDSINKKVDKYWINRSSEARNSLIYSFQNLVLIDLQGSELFAELVDETSTSLINKTLFNNEKNTEKWNQCKKNIADDILLKKSGSEILHGYLVPLNGTMSTSSYEKNNYDAIANEIDEKIKNYNTLEGFSFTRTNSRGYAEHYLKVSQNHDQIFYISYYEGDFSNYYFYYDQEKLIKIHLSALSGEDYEYYFKNDNLVLEIHYGLSHEIIDKKYISSSEFDYKLETELLNQSKEVLKNSKNYLREGSK